jgi:protoheme IX farnesyltransferase
MSLSVLTALVGLLIAPGHLDPLHGSIAIFAIAAGAGAAGALNMWYDADIDAVMTRTAMRPIPRGAVSRLEALIFGLILAGSAVAILGSALNLKAAALLAFTIFFYVVVYTIWLKRHTRQNILIGGAAGALPARPTSCGTIRAAEIPRPDNVGALTRTGAYCPAYPE